ncbi:MAG: EpsD family peptidyl-prolyl cis-trans isomerase [Betaproteobacteria bacterium]|nr:EpsD family peptidyl-prolyl cis-trans isomerase [Betaproteobacteria bacterium]
MSSPTRYVAVSLCAAVCMSGMLVSCSAKEGSDKKSASQVAVKVNKEEVSVHQVNAVLSRGGNIPPEQVDRARAVAVERLIDQELLLQQAKSNKLDRNPNVMQMIELSRREILARAYSEQIASGAVKPTEAQISKFYDENPELFSKRRIYSLQEISFQAAPERLEEVRTHLQSSTNLQQLTTWFNEQKIPFAANAGVKPAEQIPLEMLRNLSKLNAGQAAFVRTPVGGLLLFVVGVRDEPVDRTKAKPVIEGFLTNQARAESVKAEIKRLREAASIDYSDGFVPPAAEPAAPTEQGPVVSPDAAPEDASVQSIIEKGTVKLK